MPDAPENPHITPDCQDGPEPSSLESRELGPQPLESIMQELGLNNHQLVQASTQQLTHKMVAKARRGRWLSMRVRLKIQTALNRATGRNFSLPQLFNY